MGYDLAKVGVPIRRIRSFIAHHPRQNQRNGLPCIATPEVLAMGSRSKIATVRSDQLQELLSLASLAGQRNVGDRHYAVVLRFFLWVNRVDRTLGQRFRSIPMTGQHEAGPDFPFGPVAGFSFSSACLRSVIRLNDSYVAVCGVPQKLVGRLIGRAFVRGFCSFDTTKLDQNDPLVHPHFETIAGMPRVSTRPPAASKAGLDTPAYAAIAAGSLIAR